MLDKFYISFIIEEIKQQPNGGYIMEATSGEKTVIIVPIERRMKDEFKPLCKAEQRTMASKIRQMIQAFIYRKKV